MKLHDLEETMQKLYDSEINCTISTFWDVGFTVKLGDEMNGYKAEHTTNCANGLGELLHCMAEQHYPESIYVKSIWHPIHTLPKDSSVVEVWGGTFSCDTQLHNFDIEEHNPVRCVCNHEDNFTRDGVLFLRVIPIDPTDDDGEIVRARNPTHWRRV